MKNSNISESVKNAPYAHIVPLNYTNKLSSEQIIITNYIFDYFSDDEKVSVLKALPVEKRMGFLEKSTIDFPFEGIDKTVLDAVAFCLTNKEGIYFKS